MTTTKSGKQATKHHDDVGGDGGEDAGSVKSGQETEIEQKKRSRDQPVNIACPVDLSDDVLEGVRHMVMLLADMEVVEGESGMSSHGEVGQSGDNGDGRGQMVVKTFGLHPVSSGIGLGDG